MKKILDLHSAKDHYVADACIVWCFDDRFTKALNEFASQFKNYDLVKVAGGAVAQKEFILSQVKISINLHHAKKVILMTHSDCGACGGLKAFNNDCEKEKEFHEKELEKMKEYLKENLNDIEIETVFLDFSNLYATAK